MHFSSLSFALSVSLVANGRLRVGARTGTRSALKSKGSKCTKGKKRPLG